MFFEYCDETFLTVFDDLLLLKKAILSSTVFIMRDVNECATYEVSNFENRVA